MRANLFLPTNLILTFSHKSAGTPGMPKGGKRNTLNPDILLKTLISYFKPWYLTLNRYFLLMVQV